MAVSSRVTLRGFRAGRQFNRTPTGRSPRRTRRATEIPGKPSSRARFPPRRAAVPWRRPGSAVRPSAIVRVDGRPNNEINERATSSHLRVEPSPADPDRAERPALRQVGSAAGCGSIPARAGNGPPTQPTHTSRPSACRTPQFRDHTIPQRLQPPFREGTPPVPKVGVSLRSRLQLPGTTLVAIR
jgi:hypothetical protein